MSYRALRDLHSFPTRRSSDLPNRGRLRSGPNSPVQEIGSWPSPGRQGEPSGRGRLATSLEKSHESHSHHAEHARYGCERSEEHTSELQSPYDLVCRLLLEKKK